MLRNDKANCQLALTAQSSRHPQLFTTGQPRLSILRASYALIALSLLVGCGGGDPLGRQALSGTVTLDGSPVKQGSINFDPESIGAVTSSGAVITSGEFSIPQEAGLPPGLYRVRINIPDLRTDDSSEDNMTLPGEAGPAPVELAPAEWNSRSTQTIEITADGPFVFAFEI